MNKILITTICVIFLSSCGDGVMRYDQSEVITRNDIVYVFSTMEPVTGVVYNKYGGWKVEYECSYLKGFKHGKEQMWHSNGNLSFVNDFVLGEYSGLSSTYYEDGQIKTRYYWDGVYQEPDCWLPNGDKINCDELDDSQ
tara:strand:+ start:75 stop:491 length:417 start_codon:yes stop_codon:yes gene_type:complete